MNKIKSCSVVLLIGAFLLAGCAGTSSPRRVAYNTLASVGYSTDAAMKSYLDMIARGQVSTGALPSLSQKYNTFQVAYNLAISAAQMNVSAPAPSNVVDLSADLINSVERAKVMP